MEYYSLHNATTKIGRAGFPQSIESELEEGRSVWDDDYVWKLEHGVSPSFEPYLGTILVRKGATVTDLISTVAVTSGFVCSDRFKSLLERFVCGDTKFYPLFLRHVNNVYQSYYLMRCTNDYSDKVDFPKSKFILERQENEEILEELVPIESLEHYQRVAEDRNAGKMRPWIIFRPKEICFKSGFSPEHDLFVLKGIDIKTYVSQSLKGAIERAKMTGLTFDFYHEHTHFNDCA
jgi:hypothetical protein